MKGLVIKNTGSWYTVRTDDGQFVDCKVKGNFRLKGIRSTNPVAVGDRVVLTAETMAEQMKPQALKRIQSRLVLEAIAAAENIEITDENVDEQLQKMAENYQMELETLKGYMGENEIKQMKSDLAVQKAVDLIVENAK